MQTKRKEPSVDQTLVKKRKITVFKFIDIPKDSIIVILSFCSLESLSSIRLVNKTVYDASKDPMAYSMETFIRFAVKKELPIFYLPRLFLTLSLEKLFGFTT
jgi:hypothetical protein